MKELEEFFEIKLKTKPKIIHAKDRKEINHLLGRKTPRWLVGWTDGKDIYVLDKNEIDKEKTHKYSPEDYEKMIMHEKAHLYFLQLSKGKDQPNWLWEGVALYAAGQEGRKPLRLRRFLQYYRRKGKEVYKESGHAVKSLVEKHGKEKLLKLIKGLGNVKNKEEFHKLFEKVYGVELNYEIFN